MKTGIDKLFRWLIGIELALLAAHFLPYPFFSLDQENNLPTWFSACLLLAVGVSALIISHHQHLRDDRLTPGATPDNRSGQRFWLVFGIVHLYLAADEAFYIHELVEDHTPFKWFVVLGPLAGLFFWYCCRNLQISDVADRRPRLWIIGGLLIFATGALGLEAAVYVIWKLGWLSQGLLQVCFVAEEGAELLGSTFILVGCLHQLANSSGPAAACGR